MFIFCFATLALVFTRANVFAQEVKIIGNKTLTSVQYAEPDLIRAGIDSLLKAHNLSSSLVRIIGDSISPNLIQAVAISQTGKPIATIVIKHIYTVTDLVCATCNVLPASKPSSVQVEGVLSFDEVGKPTEQFSFVSFGASREEHLPIPNVIKPPEAPKTFWESTAQPILVTVGAAAIVALFFLIRS